MFAANGVRLADATTIWLLIDINNARLMTEKNLPFLMSDNSHHDALPELPDKIAIQTSLNMQFEITCPLQRYHGTRQQHPLCRLGD